MFRDLRISKHHHTKDRAGPEMGRRGQAIGRYLGMMNNLVTDCLTRFIVTGETTGRYHLPNAPFKAKTGSCLTQTYGGKPYPTVVCSS